MKKVNLNDKLMFKKLTIAQLNNVKGGNQEDPPTEPGGTDEGDHTETPACDQHTLLKTCNC